MSGIAGIIRFDGVPVERGQIEKMTAAMDHRGPDGINHWIEGPVALGQCMLRTTPESLEESQPLTNEDESLVLVMDGRVDTWEELRKDLLARGARLRNRSDAELVLRAYEAWGAECLSHFDGDFALLIWDARRREAFCARDRIGNKPFHYHWDGRRLIIASELHPIFAVPSVPQMPNDGMVAEFLAGEWLSRDETLWRGIMRLVAAHRMMVDAGGGIRIERYWSPSLDVTLGYRRDEDYIEHYRELFADCVRRTSRSHRPVAYEVSGGLDSSAVFCMAEHLRRAGGLPAPAIDAYTLAFDDESAASELSYARAVGEHWGIRINETPPSRHPLSWFSERALKDRDFPGFPNAAMFVGMREQIALKGNRVVLTGEGGDQCLAGSRTYYAEELAQRHWLALYHSFKTDVSAFGLFEPSWWFVRYGLFLFLPPAAQQALRALARRLRGTRQGQFFWLSPKFKALARQRRKRLTPIYALRAHKIGCLALLETLTDAFTDHVTENVERLGSQSGVEIRYPMRTSPFVQFAFSTPERLRLRGHTSKYIHVQALRDVLPQIIRARIDKAEFSVLFREHLDLMRGVLTETVPLNCSDWIVPERVAELFQQYQSAPQLGWPMWVLWDIFAVAATVEAASLGRTSAGS